MLRRAGDYIKLPKRKDLVVRLKFSDQEAEVYRKAKEKAIRCIEDTPDLENSGRHYKNVLQKIEALRQICTLGISNVEDAAQDAFNQLTDIQGSSLTPDAASVAIRQFVSLGLPMMCVKCDTLMSFASENPDEPLWVHLTSCLRLWCSSCYERERVDPKDHRLCECPSACPSVTIPLQNQAATASITVAHCANETDVPTKVRALIQDLKKCPKGTKRYAHFDENKLNLVVDVKLSEVSVLFSFWKDTLGITGAALTKAGISCARIDGSMNMKQRSNILREFSAGGQIDVLLLSLACCAVGLTLTSASRAYLMEPQWNPLIEEQAFARIYRISQTQEVTMVRFVMEDSIEKGG
ncbi:hypothetical protein SLS62_009744 [Diatrype stigma]|uniref:Helicase C-terminal domain-containing protein n=1 Tax=Diatrype stigma TaxID=117547 RepID=A0AAN9UES9_9PEZI